MRKKRAKALAKLCGYSSHHPRQYHAIPTGTKYEKVTYDEKGVEGKKEYDKFQFVADDKRRSYKETKKLYKRGEIK